MTVQEKLLQFINRHSDEILQFTKDLIATPSETPPGDERKIAEVILDRFERLGLKGAVVVSEIPERPNILYRLQGSGSGPTLLYVAHTDTKPVGDVRDQWQTDPFVATTKDGRLYGLGAADMKAAVAAFVYAAAALKQVAPLEGTLLLAFVADEEGGGRYGSHYLCTQYGLKADMCMIGEPSGVTREWEHIHLGCRGVFCFNIKVHGTQMHSSLSDRLTSVNASLKLAELMLRMKHDLKLKYRPHTMYPDGVTINLGVRLKGGVSFGVYPGYAEFGTDIRTVPGMQKESLIQEIKTFLEDRQREDPSLRADFELAAPPGDWIAPTEVGVDLPIAQALANACESVLGFRPPFGIYPAGTDSPNFQIKANIPTIPSFGAGMISVCHAANEWVGVKSIIQACTIYALAAYDVLHGKKYAAAEHLVSRKDHSSSLVSPDAISASAAEVD